MLSAKKLKKKMLSTGNDIVALNAIDITRTRQPRFYSKILNESEIAAYNRYEAGITFENFVWLSWSIKESAYKYLQRNNPGLVFSPTKFIVTGLEIPENSSPLFLEGTGFTGQPVYKSTVTFGWELLYSRSLMNEEFIFSVVNQTNHFENTCWGIKSIDNPDTQSQSAEVRSFLIEKFHELPRYGNLSIIKDAHGCPVLMNGAQQLDSPVSLAHHDRWVSYSFRLQ
jgi:phosphopantetheinyl transferase (holo-ACP synthase)